MVNETFDNGLTKAQAERLALLAEECGEAVQAVGKALRHGLDSRNPLALGSPTNRVQLAKELGDILAAMKLLIDAGVVDAQHIELSTAEKLVSVERWLHHTVSP